MKRSILLISAILVAWSAAASPLDEFDRVVDFTVTLKSLAQAARAGDLSAVSPDRVIMIDGTLTSISILNPEEQSFSAVLEIVGGEWTGFESIETWTCYVQVSGPGYFRRLPARPRPGDPNVIALNSHVLIVGRLAGFLPTGDSDELVPVMEGHHTRVLP